MNKIGKTDVSVELDEFLKKNPSIDGIKLSIEMFTEHKKVSAFEQRLTPREILNTAINVVGYKICEMQLSLTNGVDLRKYLKETPSIQNIVLSVLIDGEKPLSTKCELNPKFILEYYSDLNGCDILAYCFGEMFMKLMGIEKV